MDQPVGCCHRHRFIHEDAAPRAERMVAGDDQAAALITMCDQLEQHTRFRVVTFDIPEVVYRVDPGFQTSGGRSRQSVSARQYRAAGNGADEFSVRVVFCQRQ